MRFCGGEAETAQTEYTHETFIGLMSPITKGENKGAVRLDLFFKKGEAHFIPTLFAYVMNNVLGDRFKKAVPDSLDRELEGGRRQHGAWCESCGRRKHGA